jgi:hypothetical protein
VVDGCAPTAKPDKCGKLRDANLVEPATGGDYACNLRFPAKKDPVTGIMTDTLMCTDVRGLNSITPPDRYCSCRTDDLVRRVRGATHISSIDLHSGFH